MAAATAVAAAVLGLSGASCAGSGATGAAAGSSAAGAPSSATETPSPAAPPHPALDNCFTTATGTTEAVADADGGRLTLGVIGSGPRAVILSNESDEILCSWLPFAARLAAAGYRVVVFDYGGNPPASEVAVVARRLRSDGARRLVLLGASEGAKASLIAGSMIRPAVQGVVSLSAETVLYPGITVLDYVRRLHCPLLLVTAKQDPYGSAGAARQFLGTAPSRTKRLVMVAGADHGTALLAGQSGRTALPAVLAFLRRVMT